MKTVKTKNLSNQHNKWFEKKKEKLSLYQSSFLGNKIGIFLVRHLSYDKDNAIPTNGFNFFSDVNLKVEISEYKSKFRFFCKFKVRLFEVTT